MKNFIALTCLLAIASAVSTVTIQPAKFCQCDNLILQSDCNAFGLRCQWSGSQCSANPCTAINIQEQCAGTTKCQWNTNSASCAPFTSCSELKATTNLGCLQLSNQCEGSLNGVCQTTIPSTCSSYVAQSDCTYGSDGLCFWNGTTCSLWSTCSQATTTTSCQGAPMACAWNTTACIPSVCSNFTGPEYCYFTQSNPYQFTYSLCIWSSANNTCISGDDSQLNSSDCLVHSAGYFSWSSNNATSGNCRQCQYSVIMQVVIAGLLLLLA